MKNLLLIGGNGYVGRNLSSIYKHKYRINIFSKSNTLCDLKSYIKLSDYVIHLASRQKSNSELDCFEDNFELTKFIVDNVGTKKLIFFSSVHSSLNTPFGICKKKEEDYIKEKCLNYQILILPHTFGKYGKPNYNSFFNTMLYSYSNSKSINLNLKKQLFDVLPIIQIADYIEFEDGCSVIKTFNTKKITLIDFLYDIQCCKNINEPYYISIRECLDYYLND